MADFSLHHEAWSSQYSKWEKNHVFFDFLALHYITDFAVGKNCSNTPVHSTSSCGKGPGALTHPQSWSPKSYGTQKVGRALLAPLMWSKESLCGHWDRQVVLRVIDDESAFF